MECFACIHACPTDALGIDKEMSCVRFEERPGLRMDEEKCNECNRCNEVCPMGNTALSAEGCSFCIICKNRPNCILLSDGRVSFFNSVSSIARFMVLMPRIIF